MKIQLLKAKAGYHYNQVYKELDRYDCGLNLALSINSTLLSHAVKFNEIMDNLEKLDPTCPKFRFKEA